MKTKDCTNENCPEENPQPIENFYVSRGRRRGQCKTCFLAYQNKARRERYARQKKASRSPYGVGIRGDAYESRFVIVRTPDRSYPKNVPGNEVFFYRGEFRAMLEDGTCLTPGTIVKQNGTRYKVTGNLKAWEDFANADYPLDYEMPAQKLERL